MAKGYEQNIVERNLKKPLLFITILLNKFQIENIKYYLRAVEAYSVMHLKIQ